ncbi:MAG TPA: MFS transporter [Chloroflexota bacterium]|nr:MFS transporter [Chloroflexota bacterium]
MSAEHARLQSDDGIVSVRPWQMGLTYISGAFAFEFQQMTSLLIPLRAQSLGIPIELIGVLVGGGAAIPALLSVTSGAIADRFGPKVTYIISTLICAIMSVGFAFTTDFWGMMGLQLVLGMARSTAWVASQTYVSNIGSAADRPGQMGKLSFASNAGTIAAPILAGWTADAFGYQNAFAVVGATCVVFLVMGLVIPDVRAKSLRSASKRDSSGGFGTALQLMKVRGIQVALLLTFVRLWNGNGWRAFFPLFLASQGFSATLIGSVLSSNSVVSTATALFAGPLTKRATPEVVTAVALGLGALGAAISPHVASVPWVYAPSILMGTGVGLSLPLLMAIMTDDAPPDQRGVALGLRMSANQVAQASAPMAMGAMVTAFGTVIAFAMSGVLMWAILAVALWVHFIDRRAKQSVIAAP